MTTPTPTMADIVAEVSAADVAAMTLAQIDILSRRMEVVYQLPMTPKVRATAIMLTTTARRRIRELDPAMSGCDGEAEPFAQEALRQRTFSTPVSDATSLRSTQPRPLPASSRGIVATGTDPAMTGCDGGTA